MFKRVTKKQCAIARQRANALLHDVQKALKDKYKFAVRLVGSGAWGTMIEDENGEYDLDYQLLLSKNSRLHKQNGDVPNMFRSLIFTIRSRKQILRLFKVLVVSDNQSQIACSVMSFIPDIFGKSGYEFHRIGIQLQKAQNVALENFDTDEVFCFLKSNIQFELLFGNIIAQGQNVISNRIKQAFVFFF